MKKLAIALVATLAGLLIVAAAVASLLGVIYAISYSTAWLMLLIIPIPALIAAKLLFKTADRMNGYRG